jgi:Double zinc ribbon
MQCPRCQHENAPTMKFCGECGTPLRTANPSGPPAPSYAEITSALSEAIEQQTATSEILRVISSSPTDVQPVLDAVAENAARVCRANEAQVFRIDGDTLCRVAAHGSQPEGSFSQGERTPISRGLVLGRAVIQRQTIQISDGRGPIGVEKRNGAFFRLLGVG